MSDKCVQLVSMNDCIEEICGKGIVDFLNTEENLLRDEKIMNETFTQEDIIFLPNAEHEYWYVSRYAIEADIPVKIRAEVWERNQVVKKELLFYMTAEIYLDPEKDDKAFQCEVWDMSQEKKERLLTPMNEYLIPIMKPKDIEEVCEKILAKYDYPETIEELAKRMGYSICAERIYECSLSSMLFLEEGKVPVIRTQIM